jgi:ferric-dicitrate binding protein FerR (iron transport regulator)
MTDLDRAKDLIRKGIKVNWDEEYLELGAIRLESRRDRRRRAIAFVSVVTACAAVLMGLRWHSGRNAGGGAPAPTAAASAQAPTPVRGGLERALHFSDGSLAIPADDRTNVSIVDDTPSRMSAELTSGRSRFEVMPSPSRMFAVHAGAVTVIVIGTTFTVEREGSGAVDVSVEQGRVRVESAAGYRELGAGESASFAPASRADPASTVAVQATQSPRAHSEPPAWRALAEQRKFQEAFGLLPEASQTFESPRDLLLAADSARLSGHPEAAVKYLAKIVRQYPTDFSAQLAAFSLGSIYLDQLDHPGDAAFRFGQARALAGTGALSEYALARQVEALARFGDAVQARARAEEYVRLFPAGRRVELVRKLGGID